MPKRKPPRTWPNGLPRRQDNNFDRQLIGHTGLATLPEMLPLVHVTSVWCGKEIVLKRVLETNFCPVFGTELLYFFVLRPAYCLPHGNKESHQISRFPVVFVVHPEAVPEPRHVYPFDTGGAAKGAFAKQADPYVPLEDYALRPAHASASAFISWAFGDLESYFEGRLREGLQQGLSPHELVASGYLDIARMGVKGSNEHDKRASAVELAASHNVALEANVQLAIFPKQFLEGNEPFLAEIRELELRGAHVETYDWRPNRTPNEFQEDIMRICRQWYARDILR
jgi:hypothetical protein